MNARHDSGRDIPLPRHAADDSAEAQRVLTALLPWMTSVLFHLGLVVLALFLVWSVMQEPTADEPIPRIARMTDKAHDPLSRADAMNLSSAAAGRTVESRQLGAEQSLHDLDASTQSRLELIGVKGGAAGGKLAPFGATTGSAVGNGVAIYGAIGHADRIVYIVDASGSLTAELPFVIAELKRSISELKPTHQFAVVFFQNDQAIEAPPHGLKPATPTIKKAVQDWISIESGHIVPQGRTNPIAAIQRALRYQPQLIFILSDNITGSGRYEVDRDALIDMLNEANRDRRITINTIQFLYPDALNTLQEIAAAHDGVFRFIRETDLGLE